MLKVEKLGKYIEETTGLVAQHFDYGFVITGSYGKFSARLTITELSDNSAYSCKGGIYLKDNYFDAELVEVSKTLKSEAEIIWLMQSMTNSTIGIMEYLKKQKEYLNL